MTRKRLIVLAVLLALILVLIPAEAADDGVYLDFFTLPVDSPLGNCGPLVPGDNLYGFAIIFDLPVDITWDSAIVSGPVTGASNGALSAGTVLPPSFDTFSMIIVNGGAQIDAPWEITIVLDGYVSGVLTSHARAHIGCAYDGSGGYYQTPLSFNPIASGGDEEAAGEPVPGCDALITIPSSAVGATMTSDAPVYWAPGQVSDETFPAGLNVRALGVDDSGAYTKVLYVCSTYWVPTSSIGPNYDEVWNGTPLPTGVVQ